MLSVIQARNIIVFPKHNNERIHMLKIYRDVLLPSELKHWQHTVDNMLIDIESDSPMYLMIDQKFVPANTYHRRPGIHVDGYWCEGNKHTGHRPIQASHRPLPPSHLPNAKTWETAAFEEPEALLLASNVSACQVYTGEYHGVIGEGGNAENINVHHLTKSVLKANICYAGNAALLHETIALPFDCERTVVRINVPGWSPELLKNSA